MRQIVLDTETTGLDTKSGHRIIEIGAVELINRRLTGNHYHVYINPERAVDEGAFAVHGIGDEFLQDKPIFSAVAAEFYHYIKGAELVIHNAPFDIGFIDYEFKLNNPNFTKITADCPVIDTLVLAKQLHPGQKNNLDALCRRYGIDNSHRTLHGALLDAEILADVYLKMTGGQTSFYFDGATVDDSGRDVLDSSHTGQTSKINRDQIKLNLTVLQASAEECQLHQQYMAEITQ